MTHEQYQKQLLELRERHSKEIMEVQLLYAESKNPHAVGDKITDHYKTIIIGSWGLCINSGMPELIYYGVQITKKGTPTKWQDGVMYQCNIKV
jgi:hypothetical protein